MNEWTILCKDFTDMHDTFNDILDVIPKKGREVFPSTPTKYILKVLPGKGTSEVLKLYIMTKTYFEHMFKYGYGGNVISSKTVRKHIEKI